MVNQINPKIYRNTCLISLLLFTLIFSSIFFGAVKLTDYNSISVFLFLLLIVFIGSLSFILWIFYPLLVKVNKNKWRNILLKTWLSSFGVFALLFVYALINRSVGKFTGIPGIAYILVITISFLTGVFSFLLWIIAMMGKTLRKALITIGLILIGIFIILSLIQNYIIGRDQIIGSTMNDYKDKSYYFICRLCKSIKRQDVVAYRLTNNPDVDFIGKVVGLPNETIEIEKGKVIINGSLLLNEPTLDWSDWKEGVKLNITLGKDEYFTLVDKRTSPDNIEDFIQIRKFTKNNYRGKFL